MKFANDMLLPNAGSIEFSPSSDPCYHDLEVEGCYEDELWYDDDNYLRSARDNLGSIGRYSVDN
ncbi:hypothetical protein J6V86_02420 [bacterium]|nr:hypothetical protein [bacterium]